MEGLYPIIRRKRRPLVSVGDAVKRAAEKVIAQQRNEGTSITEKDVSGATPETTRQRRVPPGNHDEEASATEQSG